MQVFYGVRVPLAPPGKCGFQLANLSRWTTTVRTTADHLVEVAFREGSR
jgi:hypothetical protein